jgi:hypothetical protein
MITDQQLELLKQYKDKSYINTLLAEQSYDYYNFVKNIINIPLILCNTIMVIINSIITDQDLLKILNIILNSSTGLIISMISNFKIYEKIQQYHQLQIKFNKLNHQIDSKINNDMSNITSDYIIGVIEDYDQILESIEYTFPTKIKNRIKKQYENKMTLPSSLSVEIVEMCKDSKCCVKV